jgi:hypothetical protein
MLAEAGHDRSFRACTHSTSHLRFKPLPKDDGSRAIDHRLASARAAQRGLEPTVAYFALSLASANSTADVAKRKFKEPLTLAIPAGLAVGCGAAARVRKIRRGMSAAPNPQACTA